MHLCCCGWAQGRGRKLTAQAARYALHVTTGDALQGDSVSKVTVTLQGARSKGSAVVLTADRAATVYERPFARGQTDSFLVYQKVRAATRC